MNDNNENTVLDETDWSKLTFLTKKDEKEEAKEKTKGVKIAFLTLLSFSALSGSSPAMILMYLINVSIRFTTSC